MRILTFGLAAGTLFSVLPDFAHAQASCLITDTESPIERLIADLPGLTLTGFSDTGKTWTLQLGELDPVLTTGPAIFTNGQGSATDGTFTLNNDQLCQSYNGQASFVCHQLRACSRGDGLLAMFNEDGSRTAVIVNVLENGMIPDYIKDYRTSFYPSENEGDREQHVQTARAGEDTDPPREINLTPAALRLGQEVLDSYDGDRDKIDRVASAAPFAAMAWAVYGGDNAQALQMAARNEWVPARDADQFDLVEENLIAGDTVAMLFQLGDGDTGRGYVVAFRGTVLDGSWYTNTMGTLTPSPITTAQVRGAVKIARAVKAVHPDVVFTGHSLGGRLAQVAANETGNRAVVFNAAPLNLAEAADQTTMMMLDLILGRTDDEKIQKFRSPEDMLTALAPNTITIETVPLVEDPEWPQYVRWATALTRILGEQASFAHLAGTVALGAEATALARDEGWVEAASRGVMPHSPEVPQQNAAAETTNPGWVPVDAPGAGRRIETDNGCALRTTIDATRFTWDGACEDGVPLRDGTLTFYKGVELVERLQVGGGTEFRLSGGQLYWADDLNLTFTPARMLSVSTSQFAAVFAETQPGLNFHHRPTIDRIVQLAYRNYMDTIGFAAEPRKVDGLAVQIASSANQRHALMVVDKDGNWNGARWSYNNAAADDFAREMRDYNRQAVRDQQSQDQAATAARIESKYRLLADALGDQADALLSGLPGSLDALAHALETEKLRMMAQLEDGIQLTLPASTDFDTSGQGENRVYQVSYRITSPLARLASQQRQEMMQTNFTWDNWFSQTGSVGTDMRVQLTCNFADIAALPDRQKTVRATLVALNSTGNDISLTLSCSPLTATAARNGPTPEPVSAQEIEAFRTSINRCWAIDLNAESVEVRLRFILDASGAPVGNIRFYAATEASEDAQQAAYEAARRAVLRCIGRGSDAFAASKYPLWSQVEMSFARTGTSVSFFE